MWYIPCLLDPSLSISGFQAASPALSTQTRSAATDVACSVVCVCMSVSVGHAGKLGS